MKSSITEKQGTLLNTFIKKLSFFYIILLAEGWQLCDNENFDSVIQNLMFTVKGYINSMIFIPSYLLFSNDHLYKSMPMFAVAHK